MESLHLTTSSLPPLVTSILLMLVAVVVVVGSRGSRVGQYFLFWVLSLATWLFFAAFFYSADTPERAMDFVRGAHIGISFIPVAGLHFALAATEHRFARSPWLIGLWLVSFVFIFLMLTTDLLFSGIRQYSWGYYADYGPVGFVFVGWFSILYASAAWFMFQAWRNAVPGSIAKRRNRGLFANYVFSILGALDFLPTMGIDYFPLGWLPVSVYSLSALYLLYRYPLTGIGSVYTSEQIISSVGSGLLLIDQDHVVRLANPALERLLHMRPTEAIGKPVESALPADQLGLRINELILGGKETVADLPISNNETGEWQVIKISITPVNNEVGARVGSLCILQDVTESRRSRSDLESLVAQRTHELETMRDRAMDASQAKSAFLASMSHELRTPLNAIIGYSEMLSEDLDKLEKAVVLEDLDRVQSSARHLLSLINNILDLSKIEAGKMEVHIDPFDIEVLVTDIKATTRPIMKKSSNEFRVHLDKGVGVVRSDPVKLKQILLNLLSNAAKFTDRGMVDLSVRRDGNGHVVFVVSDTGVGIGEEEIGQLFGDYQQAGTTAGKYGGTGLGLAIVQRFVELLEGTVDVSSDKGKGTEFTIYIPG